MIRRGTTMRVSSLLPRSFAALLVAAPLFVTAASAQAPATVRIRGAIEAVDGSVLTVKSREGSEMKVHLTDNVTVVGIAKASLADIKPNSYIGVSGMPEADGTQKALAIHIFPEAQRGTGEGFRAWDLRPNSTMTNATVEKTVVVGPDTPIVSFVSGDKSELKSGAKIIIFGATKKDDGTLETNRLGVGGDGIPPPM